MNIRSTTALPITGLWSRFRVLLLAAMVLLLVAVLPARISEAAPGVQPVSLEMEQQTPDWNFINWGSDNGSVVNWPSDQPEP